MQAFCISLYNCERSRLRVLKCFKASTPKQTAGKDCIYPPPLSFQTTKAGNTKRRALRTTAYYLCTKVHTKYRPYSNASI